MYSNDPLAQLASGFAGNPVRFRQKSLGATTANQQQYQVAVRGRFRLDAKGLFGINAGLYMGANFVAGFDNTGLGMGKAQSNLYLKHLYLSALPLNEVELQYGSLDFDMTSQPILRDTHITATSPANESVSNGLKSFFDDLSVAYGYVGDLNSPNAIGRLNRLEQSKFHRFMLKEDITERAWISTDYAFQAGTQTWREAIRIPATELRFLDTFHGEIYEVSRIHPGYGFAAYGEKAVPSRFVAGGSYADIDRAMLSSDRFGRGSDSF